MPEKPSKKKNQIRQKATSSKLSEKMSDFTCFENPGKSDVFIYQQFDSFEGFLLCCE